jgi:SOS response regulatory protein OraA/RecX
MEKKKTAPEEALGKLRQLCSRQEKCEADVVTLLNRWGVEKAQHPAILASLKQDDYLSESRYVAAFVKDKIKLEHWGMVKIAYMLRHKGISGKVTEEALRHIDKSEYRTMITRELEKKRKSLRGSRRENWAKLARYGASRGYEMEYMQDFLSALEPES